MGVGEKNGRGLLTDHSCLTMHCRAASQTLGCTCNSCGRMAGNLQLHSPLSLKVACDQTPLPCILSPPPHDHNPPHLTHRTLTCTRLTILCNATWSVDTFLIYCFSSRLKWAEEAKNNLLHKKMFSYEVRCPSSFCLFVPPPFNLSGSPGFPLFCLKGAPLLESSLEREKVLVIPPLVNIL